MGATTKAEDSFSQIQVGPIIYLNNYYDYLKQGGIAQWDIPCGDQLAWGCWESPVALSEGETCKLTYNVPETGGDGYQRVRLYMAAVLGSLGGRDSSYGVGDKTGCFETPILAETGRCNSKVYDMRHVHEKTSLPLLYNEIEEIELYFDYIKHLEGSLVGISNLFLDSYFEYIGNPDSWPEGYQDEWGPYNKINGNKTSAFNLNVWFARGVHPDGDKTTLWTGGEVMREELILPSGTKVSINCKHERNSEEYDSGCQGGFFYVGVLIDPEVPEGLYKLVYKELSDYLGSEEFKQDVLSHSGCKKIWEDLGSPPFIVDEPHNYVLPGIAMGIEVWYSPTDELSVSCFDELAFKVNGKYYGKISLPVHSEYCVDKNTIKTSTLSEPVLMKQSQLLHVSVPYELEATPLMFSLQSKNGLLELSYEGYYLEEGYHNYTYEVFAGSEAGTDEIQLVWSNTGPQSHCASYTISTVQVGETLVTIPTSESILNIVIGEVVTLEANSLKEGTYKINTVSKKSDHTVTAESYINNALQITGIKIGTNIMSMILNDGSEVEHTVVVGAVSDNDAWIESLVSINFDSANNKLFMHNTNKYALKITITSNDGNFLLVETLQAESGLSLDVQNFSPNQYCVSTEPV